MLGSTLLAHGVDWVNEGAHLCDCKRDFSIDVSRQGQCDLSGLWAAGSMFGNRELLCREPERTIRMIERMEGET